MVILFNQYFKDNRKPTLPIGLLSIATYLNVKGIETKIFEAENNTNVSNIIKRYKPSIVGIGCQYTEHYSEVISIARTIKYVDKSIKVVIGGNHASSLNDVDSSVDHIIKGEGEIAFYDLCSGNISNKIINPYPLIKDLDTLPSLDYTLVNFDRYLIRNSPFMMRTPGIGIITSRGCPQNCIYCTVKGVWGRSWRGKSPERVVNEMAILSNEYGVKEFAILDDSCSADTKRWESILDLIIERKLRTRWTTPNGIAHWTLTKKILDKMKEAGCYRITLGVESANQRIRKFLGKPFSLPTDIINHANKIGMWTISTNIIGFPDEQEYEMVDTLEYSKRSNVDFTTFYILEAYPTADIYKFKLNRSLAESLQFKFYRSFIINRLLKFYTIFNKIKSIEDLKYMLKLAGNGIKILTRMFTARDTKGLLYD